MNTFLSEIDLVSQARFTLFTEQQLAPVVDSLVSREGNLAFFLQKMAKAGFLGLTVPKEYNGSSGPFLHAALLIEALSVYDPGIGLTLAAHLTVIELLKHFGATAQQSKYLPLLASGEILGTFAYTENGAESGFAGIQTTIKTTAEEKTIQGQKQLVVNARLAKLIIVPAVEPSANGQKSFGLWLADATSAHAIEVKENEPYIGLTSAYLDDLHFNKCPVGSQDKLGTSSESDNDLDKSNAQCDKQFTFGISVMRTLLAAAACGLLEGALRQSANFARSNNKNGESVGKSQAVQWRLADLNVSSSAGRLLTYRAAWSAEADEPEFSKYAAICKDFATRAARMHSAEAGEIMGILSCNDSSSLAKSYRNAKMLEQYAGTHDEQLTLLSSKFGI